MGGVSGIIMSGQFGINWSVFPDCLSHMMLVAKLTTFLVIGGLGGLHLLRNTGIHRREKNVPDASRVSVCDGCEVPHFKLSAVGQRRGACWQPWERHIKMACCFRQARVAHPWRWPANVYATMQVL